MKPSLKQRIFWPAVTLALSAVLITLGTLQYRWSQEVSDATTARMKAGLASSMLGFRQDFARELSSLTVAFQNETETRPSTGLNRDAEDFRRWEKLASHAGIVKTVYIAEQLLGQETRLLYLNKASSVFEATSWPPELKQLHDFLPRPFVMHEPGRRPEDLRHKPHVPPEAGGRFGSGEPDDHRIPREHESSHGPAWHDGAGGRGPGGPFFAFSPKYRAIVIPNGMMEHERHAGPWFIDWSIPALVHPVADHFKSNSTEPGQMPSRWIIVELDSNFLERHLFPELAARYFPTTDGLGYDVTVISDKDTKRTVYSSSTQLSQTDADASLDLFAPSTSPRGADSVTPHFRGGPSSSTSSTHSWDFHSGTLMPIPGNQTQGNRNWQLLVRNRQGSVETAVASLRRRNLAVSFGVLLVLAATMGMVVVASQRARRLAQLQLDFVAGVSHELRTPIAVISSAAENIADGLLENREQITRYGQAIKSQAAQLKQLVEQILLFASTRHTEQRYHLRNTYVPGVINVALENMAGPIRTSGFKIEKNVQSDLPAVMADFQALSQCLQNLIMNAVKYGGAASWIGVTAASRRVASGKEVMITISDRGIGIAPEELKQVFDPFYRGAAVREAQIHGSGLGLPLAKSIIEAMGGHITVESNPGNGSSFTIHLPVAEASTQTEAVMNAPANPKIFYSK